MFTQREEESANEVKNSSSKNLIDYREINRLFMGFLFHSHES